MTKCVLLTLTLLCCSAWMIAQSTPQSGSPPNSTYPSSQTGNTDNGQASPGAQSSHRMGSEASIEGCLMGSNGSYTLTDANGNQYQLEGNTSKLASHVNTQVQIRGSETSAESSGMSGRTASGATGTGTANKMFHVKSVKRISNSCSSSK
jgi:hypothetical protein